MTDNVGRPARRIGLRAPFYRALPLDTPLLIDLDTRQPVELDVDLNAGVIFDRATHDLLFEFERSDVTYDVWIDVRSQLPVQFQKPALLSDQIALRRGAAAMRDGPTRGGMSPGKEEEPPGK